MRARRHDDVADVVEGHVAHLLVADAREDQRLELASPFLLGVRVAPVRATRGDDGLDDGAHPRRLGPRPRCDRVPARARVCREPAWVAPRRPVCRRPGRRGRGNVCRESAWVGASPSRGETPPRQVLTGPRATRRIPPPMRGGRPRRRLLPRLVTRVAGSRLAVPLTRCATSPGCRPWVRRAAARGTRANAGRRSVGRDQLLTDRHACSLPLCESARWSER